VTASIWSIGPASTSSPARERISQIFFFYLYILVAAALDTHPQIRLGVGLALSLGKIGGGVAFVYGGR